jgi:hypothetical protein
LSKWVNSTVNRLISSRLSLAPNAVDLLDQVFEIQFGEPPFPKERRLLAGPSVEIAVMRDAHGGCLEVEFPAILIAFHKKLQYPPKKTPQ